jgi:hypothetical protein
MNQATNNEYGCGIGEQDIYILSCEHIVASDEWGSLLGNLLHCPICNEQRTAEIFSSRIRNWNGFIPVKGNE